MPTGTERPVTMSIKIRVTEEERASIKRAAAQGGFSVTQWAELNLVDLARIETSAGGTG